MLLAVLQRRYTVTLFENGIEIIGGAKSALGGDLIDGCSAGYDFPLRFGQSFFRYQLGKGATVFLLDNAADLPLAQGYRICNVFQGDFLITMLVDVCFDGVYVPGIAFFLRQGRVLLGDQAGKKLVKQQGGQVVLFLLGHRIKTAIFLGYFADIEFHIRRKGQHTWTLGKTRLQLFLPCSWFAGIFEREKQAEASGVIGEGTVLDLGRNDQDLIFIGPGLVFCGDLQRIACDEKDFICKVCVHRGLLPFYSGRVHNRENIADAKHF